MKAILIVGTAICLLVAAGIPLTSLAEDQPKMTAAQIADGQSKAGVANSLIVLGRAAKDADMLMVAARLLADINAPVADPAKSTDGNPAYYDVDAIVVEAEGYAANRKAGKPTARNYQGFCHYEYLCNSLSCSYVWVC